MRTQWSGKRLFLFLCLIPAIVFSQGETLPEFSKALEKRFLSESATMKDAEKVVQALYSSNDQEFSHGLFFSPFVAPRFPSLKDKIERKLIQILNSDKGERYFQAAEAALAIHFSQKNAEKLTFKQSEGEINLVKALIKERAGVKMERASAGMIAEFEAKNGGDAKLWVDEKSLKDALGQCTLFKEIIEIAFAMKCYALSYGFSILVSGHPQEFDTSSVSYAQGILEQLSRENPQVFPGKH